MFLIKFLLIAFQCFFLIDKSTKGKKYTFYPQFQYSKTKSQTIVNAQPNSCSLISAILNPGKATISQQFNIGFCKGNK